MTMTVKLPPALEQSLRERSAALGRPASELIREALQAYLSATREATPSAHALGADLFGRYAGPANLAATRKQAFAEVVSQKRAGRRA